MNHLKSTALTLGLLVGGAQQAAAHVSYYDLTDPVLSPGGVNTAGSFSNNGWYTGTTPQLGDSHAVAEGSFFNFHIGAGGAKINLTFSDPTNSGALNPAFSLYSGMFALEAHDDTTIDPLNPVQFVPTPTPHSVKLPSPVDDGVTADATGRVSPFRDTANLNFAGQFNALGSWSMANNEGDWNVVEYITHVAPTGGNSVSLLNFFLPEGDYTVAAAGGSNTANVVTGLAGTLSFSATAVPVPAAFWLLGSALAGMGVIGRRKA